MEASDEAQLTNALRAAFDAGYRYIDTAEIYANEQVVGAVLKEYIDAGKLKREDVFITTKLPFYGHDNPSYFIEQSLKKLQTDYIDLYLIHSPLPMKKINEGEAIPEGVTPFVRKSPGTGETVTLIPNLYPFIDTWRVLEKYYNDGKLKALGVSNFNEEQLQGLYDQATVKPQNIQVECHILFQQKSLFNLCKKLNITLTAYGPIGSPGRVI
uniref:Aldo_ket_red domain-containing protein n=1 Tax=Panagrellus redivivus TaxID=6233 RepID=A0A7E4VHY2_PANRE